MVWRKSIPILIILLALIPIASANPIPVPTQLPHAGLHIVKPYYGQHMNPGKIQVKAYLVMWPWKPPIEPLSNAEKIAPVYPIIGKIYLDGKLIKTAPFRPIYWIKPLQSKRIIPPYARFVLDTTINVQSCGKHTLAIEAVYKGRVIAKDKVVFYVDKHEVTLTFLSPRDGQVIIGNKVKVAVLATDRYAVNFATNPAAFAKIFVDGNFVVRVPFKPYVKPGMVYIPEYNTKIATATIKVLPGKHVITVVATDVNGRSLSKASVTITVIPEISIPTTSIEQS
jgi:hypothetical protein